MASGVVADEAVSTNTQEAIRVLMVGDHALFCESLARALNAEPDLNVEHGATMHDPALPLSQRPFDLVLLDYDLGAERAYEFLNAARSIGYAGFILVFGACVSNAAARLLMNQGVKGVFHKQQRLSKLVAAIRTVSAGGFWVDSSFALPSDDSLVRTVPGVPPFTRLECKVQRLIVEGMSNKEIARQLQFSESYVKAIVQRLFDKTGVRTRSQLVRLAVEQYRDKV